MPREKHLSEIQPLERLLVENRNNRIRLEMLQGHMDAALFQMEKNKLEKEANSITADLKKWRCIESEETIQFQTAIRKKMDMREAFQRYVVKVTCITRFRYAFQLTCGLTLIEKSRDEEEA